MSSEYFSQIYEEQSRRFERRREGMTLNDLIRVRDWEAASDRLRAHRREASGGGGHGHGGPTMTALHWACRNDPPPCFVAWLAEARPEALLAVDGEGDTPLHAACRWGASADVVSLLIRAGRDHLESLPGDFGGDGDLRPPPDPCTTPNRSGCTALHHACRSDMPPPPSSSSSLPSRPLCTDVVRTVARANPAAICARDYERGSTPLHLACTDGTRNARAIEALLIEAARYGDGDGDDGPSGESWGGGGTSSSSSSLLRRAVRAEDGYGCSPVHVLYPTFAPSVDSILRRDAVAAGGGGGGDAGALLEEGRAAAVDCVGVMSLLLRGALGCGPPRCGGVGVGSFRILHTCCSLGWMWCPEPFLRLVLRLGPGQLLERDGMGNLPLHLACGHGVVALDPRDRRPGGRRSWRREVSGFAPASFVPLLVGACPDSVRVPDGRGRLPLHIAAEAGLPWEHEPWGRRGAGCGGGGGANDGSRCLRLIFETEPNAVVARDPSTGLYPFMLAACALPEPDYRETDTDSKHDICTAMSSLSEEIEGQEDEFSDVAVSLDIGMQASNAFDIVRGKSSDSLDCDQVLTATYELIRAAPYVIGNVWTHQ